MGKPGARNATTLPRGGITGSLARGRGAERGRGAKPPALPCRQFTPHFHLVREEVPRISPGRAPIRFTTLSNRPWRPSLAQSARRKPPGILKMPDCIQAAPPCPGEWRNAFAESIDQCAAGALVHSM